jgi:hypothetical protein
MASIAASISFVASVFLARLQTVAFLVVHAVYERSGFTVVLLRVTTTRIFTKE